MSPQVGRGSRAIQVSPERDGRSWGWRRRRPLARGTGCCSSGTWEGGGDPPQRPWEGPALPPPPPEPAHDERGLLASSTTRELVCGVCQPQVCLSHEPLPRPIPQIPILPRQAPHALRCPVYLVHCRLSRASLNSEGVQHLAKLPNGPCLKLLACDRCFPFFFFLGPHLRLIWARARIRAAVAATATATLILSPPSKARD